MAQNIFEQVQALREQINEQWQEVRAITRMVGKQTKFLAKFGFEPEVPASNGKSHKAKIGKVGASMPRAKRKLSAEGREKIREAQRKRWAQKDGRLNAHLEPTPPSAGFADPTDTLNQANQ